LAAIAIGQKAGTLSRLSSEGLGVDFDGMGRSGGEKARTGPRLRAETLGAPDSFAHARLSALADKIEGHAAGRHPENRRLDCCVAKGGPRGAAKPDQFEQAIKAERGGASRRARWRQCFGLGLGLSRGGSKKSPTVDNAAVAAKMFHLPLFTTALSDKGFLSAIHARVARRRVR